jgi:hypothetical protein
VTKYELRVGTTGVGSYNLYGYGIQSPNLSATVTNLPVTGVTVYVQLISFVNGVAKPNNYTYTAAGTAAPSVLLTPTDNKLTSSTVTFTWSPGSGVTKNEIRIGTTGVGSSNIYGYGITQTTGSATVSGLPTTGVTVYVQLRSTINGGDQVSNYTFTAAGTAAPSVLLTPTNNKLTSSTVTFTWSPGSGVTKNEIRIGTTGVGSWNIYGYGITQTTGSATVSGLPTTGITVYVQLKSTINGVDQVNNYTFTSM